MIKDVETWRVELKRLRTDFQSACLRNIAFEIERTLYYSALVMRKFSETPFVRRGFLSPTINSRKFALAKGCLDGSSWIGAKFQFDLRKSGNCPGLAIGHLPYIGSFPFSGVAADGR
jgi:hypothetical protein